MLAGEVGYADGYGNSEGLPFFKNYYAGGIGSVRGYKSSTWGPSIPWEGEDRLGGTRKVIGNAELLWALPGLENTARLGLFFDAGQVYAAKDKLDAGRTALFGGCDGYLDVAGWPIEIQHRYALEQEEGRRRQKPSSSSWELLF